MRDIPEPLSMQQRCGVVAWYMRTSVKTGVQLRCAQASSVVGPGYFGSTSEEGYGSTFMATAATLAEATIGPTSCGHLELVEGVALLPDSGARGIVGGT